MDDSEDERIRAAEAFFQEEEYDDYNREYEEYEDEVEEEEEEKAILPPAVVQKTTTRPPVVQPSKRPVYDDFFPKQPVLGARQMNITLMNGDSRFCDLRSALPSTNNSRLGSHSLHQIDSETFQRLESQVEYELAMLRSKMDDAEPEPIPATAAVGGACHVPLVQRFSPKKFIDLLSHEKKNRDALKWLKSWDAKALKQQQQQQSANASEAGNTRTSHYHPKILLLTGPAGTGKTTLAHVIAKHCNYRVVEINASDDRTALALAQHLENVTEMQAEVFQHDQQRSGRKNLLVLDEVDGILDGVPLLVQYAKDASKQRPIICTCNDAFAPALRALRQVALVLTIPLPARSRLVKRLKELLVQVNVRALPGALELLCERMEDDIRACLNALDFWLHSTSSDAAAHAMRELSRGEVQSLPAFAKDSSRDLWQLWRELLTSTNASASSQQHVFSLDVDVVLDGVHENFPSMRYVDASFNKTHRACEWLCFADAVHTRARAEMDFSFDSYLPPALHGVGASLGNATLQRKLQFPNAARAHRQQLLRNEETLREFPQLPSEVLRQVPAMVFPHRIRAGIPAQHLLPAERNELDRISALLHELHVCWKEEEHGRWSLDPPIHELVRFEHNSQAWTLSSADLAKSLNLRKRKLEPQQPQVRARKQVKQDEAVVTPAAVAPVVVAVRKDFFGRALAVQPQEALRAQRSAQFIFKFNEGFTDAVRRTLRIKDLV